MPLSFSGTCFVLGLLPGHFEKINRGSRSISAGAASAAWTAVTLEIYLITAGPTGLASSPPVAPNNFRLYTWTGNPSHAPIERPRTFPSGYTPEGAILPGTPIPSNAVANS